MCEAVFLSEDAPISTTISQLGFNTSPVLMLNLLEVIDSSVGLAGVDAGGTIAAAALEARDLSCTSLSEAV